MSDIDTIFVSFSGGRTSAYMCYLLLKNNPENLNYVFVFANTGLEHDKTLDFVDACDRYFNLNLVWVEALINPVHGKGVRHSVVNYQSAARNGEPFEHFIKKYGIPNRSYPQCSERLKSLPMESYRRSLGFRAKHKTCIGIRSDEIDRMSANADRDGLIYPLISRFPTTKSDVLNFWASMPFNLEIPEHYGNCVTCWKKSKRKLLTIASEQPGSFDFMVRMEGLYRGLKSANENGRVFFRSHETADDILIQSKDDFEPFVDQSYFGELLDFEDGCGSSCEIE